MSKVFFTKDLTAVDKIFDAAGFGSLIKKEDFVALKIHFGERGNTGYIKSERVKSIVGKVKAVGGLPFWTDSNTLYKGSRGQTLAHLQTAADHGYSFNKTGAHVLIADGLEGHNFEKIKVNYKHFKELFVGSLVKEIDVIIALSHFKGHEAAGFGGALKNVGMGLAARAGKQQMHSDLKPNINKEKCTACGRCLNWCPEDAITWAPDGKAQIDFKKCIGCAECVVTCRSQAIAISWAGEPDIVQSKIVEYAAGILNRFKNKAAFINFLTDITPTCDCFPVNKPALLPDVGIMASTDPVALDQASVDLVNLKAGKDIFKETWPEVDWSVQLKYAEEIGLGSRKYELVTI